MSSGFDADERAGSVAEAIASNPVWYHTIELAPGLTTPGQVDMRALAERVLPDDLSGKRALDVGTFDGFWAFELERRGAEVVAIDVDSLDSAEWPPNSRDRLEREAAELDVVLGRGFAIAAEALGSKVDRRVCNFYDLDAEAIGGSVDFAFVGAILLHLRDPVAALERLGSVLGPDGEARLFEPISLALSVASPRRGAARFQPLETPFNWWVPNLRGLRDWVEVAGLHPLQRPRLLRARGVREMRQTYALLRARR